MAVVGFEPTPPERLEPREPACEGASSEMMEMLEAIANHVRAVQRLGPLRNPARMKSPLREGAHKNWPILGPLRNLLVLYLSTECSQCDESTGVGMDFLSPSRSEERRVGQDE